MVVAVGLVGEVFKVHAQDRIQQDKVFTWGFSHFSPGEKSAGSGPHPGSELSADFTPWTPAAHGVPMVPEPVLEAQLG